MYAKIHLWEQISGTSSSFSSSETDIWAFYRLCLIGYWCFVILHPFKQDFSHVRKLEGWSWKVECNETPISIATTSASRGNRIRDRRLTHWAKGALTLYRHATFIIIIKQVLQVLRANKIINIREGAVPFVFLINKWTALLLRSTEPRKGHFFSDIYQKTNWNKKFRMEIKTTKFRMELKTTNILFR